MISKEEFDDIMICEHHALSYQKLYTVYQYIDNIDEIRNNFELKRDVIWANRYSRIELKKINYIKEFYYDTIGCNEQYQYGDTSFWVVSKLKDLIKIQAIQSKFLVGTSKSSIENYVDIVLNHMIPINNKYVQPYLQYLKERQTSSARKREINNKQKINSSGGIYGIYENDQLVYIGMTMRPFEARWKEHQERIEKRSNELALYNLIDANAKIEFKKLLEVDKMDSNDKITKRDLQAMEFALIQEHRPKYNFAGRSQPYQF